MDVAMAEIRAYFVLQSTTLINLPHDVHVPLLNTSRQLGNKARKIPRVPLEQFDKMLNVPLDALGAIQSASMPAGL